jgi:transcriptional regulator with XRE-family HTH domain
MNTGNLGLHSKIARAARGLSQQALARILSCCEQVLISLWESAYVVPDKYLARVNAFLNLSPQAVRTFALLAGLARQRLI